MIPCSMYPPYVGNTRNNNNNTFYVQLTSYKNSIIIPGNDTLYGMCTLYLYTVITREIFTTITMCGGILYGVSAHVHSKRNDCSHYSAGKGSTPWS